MVDNHATAHDRSVFNIVRQIAKERKSMICNLRAILLAVIRSTLSSVSLTKKHLA